MNTLDNEFEQEDLQVIRELWAQHLLDQKEQDMQYKIDASRDVTQVATIYVEADSEEEAIKMARKVATTGPANWEVTNIEYTEYEVTDTVDS
jgi:K+-sensing histidine kinase KdpD